MKVLIIDPWCSDNFEIYTIGLCDGLSKVVDTTLISAFHETRKNTRYRIIPVFFKHSDRIKKRGILRSVIRGLEYVFDYFKVLRYVKKETYDIIHIEWALSYKIDAFIDKRLKKQCAKIVYTAHNAIPHINGEKYIEDLKTLHKNFDAIVVHGETIQKEYLSYFPEDKMKVFIQRYGADFTQKTIYNYRSVEETITRFIDNKSENGKLVVFVGAIYYNKGTDRVIKYWNSNEINSKNKLIVAGKVSADYKELNEVTNSVSDNILFLPRYLNDDEYAYVLSKADIVTIPYRHASMSGIVYSAAAFSKPIVYTDTGAIKEYVGEEGGFISENTSDCFARELSNAISLEKKVLESCGSKLHDNIYKKYNWDEIARKLVKEVYGNESE